ncbi:hypothetical protein [Maritimibacter sp. 55A14]|uniref:hypothetical protein n=1 Tax=Maritimibacter sp. 55A14 TaxID=2174844 RepID=UPI0011B257A5|nr:hypothetical protein [Maritimibacter sp. 55A14]
MTKIRRLSMLGRRLSMLGRRLSMLGRRLVIGATCGVFVLSNVAMSQTSKASDGPRFLGVGERSSMFKDAPIPDECDFISYNVSFCTDGTDWVLERKPIHGEQALYQLSEDRRASFTVIPMKKNAALNLTPVEIETLLDQRIFADGPRGQMTIETNASEILVPNGGILHRRAFVRDTEGHVHLLQVTVSTLNYGLGFFETTMALSSTVETPQISEEHFAFHDEFLKIIRISISVKGVLTY